MTNSNYNCIIWKISFSQLGGKTLNTKVLEAVAWLSCRQAAKETLAYMRKCPEKSLFLIGTLRKNMGDARMTLENLGTSEEEISSLLLISQKAYAKELLEKIRKKKFRSIGIYDCYYDLLNAIINSGLSLNELGTSKRELLRFEKKCKHPFTWWIQLTYQTCFAEKFEQLRGS